MGNMVAKENQTPGQKSAQKGSQEGEQGVPSSTVRRSVGETVRISFRMQRCLHTRLKLESVRQGRTIVSLLEGLVAEQTPLA
jgi:hypothetical protein